LFHYPLPNALAWDRQLLPTAAMGKDLGVLAISKSHAERLLTQSPLKVKGGPLSRVRQPAIGVVYVNAAGLLSTIRPWVTWALQNSDLDKESVQQVEQVLKILEVFRSYSSVTYPENGALITHTEFAFRDVE